MEGELSTFKSVLANWSELRLLAVANGLYVINSANVMVKGTGCGQDWGPALGVHCLALPLMRGVTLVRLLILKNCSFIISGPRGNR